MIRLKLVQLTIFKVLHTSPFREDRNKRKIIETRERRKKAAHGEIGAYQVLNNLLRGVCLTAVLQMDHHTEQVNFTRKI